MTLDVLISTIYRAGIERVATMALPRVDGVHYIVSWQSPKGDVPIALQRPDVTVSTLAGRGVSRNRNHAISLSTADICLVSDDDVRYTVEQLQAVIHTFQVNPDVELATFRYTGPDNRYYPDVETDISHSCPKNYSVVCFEIAFRRLSVASKVHFNELIGPGDHPLQAGEDVFFLLQAQRRGIRCRFFPITITHHEGLTTGCRPMSPGVLRTQGAYIAVQYGITGPLRLLLFSWRAWRSHKASLLAAVRYSVSGYFYGLCRLSRDGSVR
jgi:hypothetical protein